MTRPKNVLVFVHGMVPSRYAKSWEPTYERFRDAIVHHEHDVEHLVDDVAYVEWHLEHEQREAHERLAAAERFVSGNVEYDVVRTRPGEGNVLLSGLSKDFGVPLLRGLVTNLREGIVQFGLADAIYYTSPDGERAIRRSVYDQVTAHLERFTAAPAVRLHVIAHSLGVTIAHDFLFGLFGPKTPSFIEDTGAPNDAARRYERARARADRGELTLGSFVSMASQLPLFLLRSQALVDRFARREAIDPLAIGVRGDAVRWLLFYDIDDVLAFSTRGLYDPATAIREVQVDCADDPRGAHDGYWTHEAVHREVARLFLANMS